MMRRATMLALCLVSSACQSYTAKTPPGFAEMKVHKRSPYVYRAASPEGLVLAVRVEKNEPKGDLPFWVGVLDSRLQEQDYTFESSKTFVCAKTTGRELVYRVERDGRAHHYRVQLVVSDQHVTVVEFGGATHRLMEALPQLEKAAASLRLRGC